jgi:hypothetical protein
MTQVSKSGRIRTVVAAAFVAAALTAGSGLTAWSWMPQSFEPRAGERAGEHRSYSERRLSDGTCELVDAQGVPLYDSQFSQRTGSSPCDQG